MLFGLCLAGLTVELRSVHTRSVRRVATCGERRRANEKRAYSRNGNQIFILMNYLNFFVKIHYPISFILNYCMVMVH